jgi:chromosome segregation ATPase
MIKNFSKFNINEEDSSYLINQLNERISKLEEENDRLEDRISELKDEISDLVDTVSKKEDDIYGLENSIEKAEKQISKLERENEKYEETEANLIDEKNFLSRELDDFLDPYSGFEDGDEYKKEKLTDVFLIFIDIMREYPIEFGNLIKSRMGNRTKESLYDFLNKEWLDTYTGKGSSFLNRMS